MVTAGEVPPRHLLALVERLPEGSMFSASLRGGDDWRLWLEYDGHQRALGDIYDAINNNTVYTGHWKKGKAPQFADYPTPESMAKKLAEKRKRRERGGLVAALHKSMSRLFPGA